MISNEILFKFSIFLESTEIQKIRFRLPAAELRRWIWLGKLPADVHVRRLPAVCSGTTEQRFQSLLGHPVQPVRSAM